MKTIIAGSRGITRQAVVNAAVAASGITPTEVVSGEAAGVDTLGENWAKAHGVPVKGFPAKWRRADGSLGRGAGFARNQAMADYADALIAVWDGESRGTADMIGRAKRRNLKVFVYEPRAQSTPQPSAPPADHP